MCRSATIGGLYRLQQSYIVRAEVSDRIVFQLREICSLMSKVPQILTQMAPVSFRVQHPDVLIVAWYDHIKGGRSSLALLLYKSTYRLLDIHKIDLPNPTT